MYGEEKCECIKLGSGVECVFSLSFCLVGVRIVVLWG